MQIAFILLTLVLSISIAVHYKISAALLFLFGAVLVWISSYQAVSALIHARGKNRITIPLVQSLIVFAGFVLLFFSEASLTIFRVHLSSLQYGGVTVFLGFLLALTSRPSNEEIRAVQEE